MSDTRLLRVQNLQNTIEDFGQHVLPRRDGPQSGWGQLPYDVAVDLAAKYPGQYLVPDMTQEQAAEIRANRPRRLNEAEQDAILRGKATLPPLSREQEEILEDRIVVSVETGIDNSKPLFLTLSPIPWGMGGQGQTPTELSRGLAQAGANVIFTQFQQPSRYFNDYPEPKGVTILAPPDEQWVSAKLTDEQKARAKEYVRTVKSTANGVTGTVLVTCPLPAFLEIAKRLKEEGWKTAYLCVDNWTGFSVERGEVLPWDREVRGNVKVTSTEAELIDFCDYVLATSQFLTDKMTSAGANAVVLPNGVDIAQFPGQQVDRPGDMRNGSPTLVYWGHLFGHWFDWDLLLRVAEELPQSQINLIGAPPVQAACPDWPLFNRPKPDNVNLLGFKPHGELWRYGVNADVFIIPFAKCEVTQGIDAIKVKEALACGRPIVASGLDSAKGVPGVKVTTPLQFVKWIKEAAKGGIPESTRPEVVKFLQENTWIVRANELIALTKE